MAVTAAWASAASSERSAFTCPSTTTLQERINEHHERVTQHVNEARDHVNNTINDVRDTIQNPFGGGGGGFSGGHPDPARAPG